MGGHSWRLGRGAEIKGRYLRGSSTLDRAMGISTRTRNQGDGVEAPARGDAAGLSWMRRGSSDRPASPSAA